MTSLRSELLTECVGLSTARSFGPGRTTGQKVKGMSFLLSNLFLEIQSFGSRFLSLIRSM